MLTDPRVLVAAAVVAGPQDGPARLSITASAYLANPARPALQVADQRAGRGSPRGRGHRVDRLGATGWSDGGRTRGREP